MDALTDIVKTNKKAEILQIIDYISSFRQNYINQHLDSIKKRAKAEPHKKHKLTS